MAEVAPETLVDGRYRVLERLGSGGMADVFLAQDSQLGRTVALKLLHRRFAADGEFVERFRREAQSAAGLQHPNVVGVFDRGEWDGTYYIAMEHLAGRTLDQVVRADAPLDPVRAIDLTVQILKASRFAHKRGVIHRDLKPQNVIVDDEDRVKVTDFGIARAGASDMTETGSILGTARYLSPEQAQGHAVSERSDLYAVGVILYELLTGRVPFDSDSIVSIAVKHVSEDPQPPSAINPGVPPDLEATVMWALNKAPERRPPDADAFLAALEDARARILDGEDGGATGAVPAVAGPDPELEEAVAGQRRSLRNGLLALLALVLLAGAGLAAYLLTRPEQVRVPGLVGQTIEVAQTRLENEGFVVNVIRRTSDRPTDRVIGQTPFGGEEVDEGSTVTLTVSDGPGEAVVPDVEGETVAAARRALRRRGFRVAVEAQASSSVAAGRVVSASPEPGTELQKGRTVTLRASTGPPRVSVPGVVGQDRASARDELEDAGFTVAERRTESEEEEGTVVAQSPTAGATLTEGSSVTITVAAAAQVRIPDVVGLTRDEAVNELSSEGFTPRLRSREVDTPDEDGVVLEQSPGAGGRARDGSSVTLVVGSFTPDLDPGEQPPEETVPPEGAEPDPPLPDPPPEEGSDAGGSTP